MYIDVIMADLEAGARFHIPLPRLSLRVMKMSIEQDTGSQDGFTYSYDERGENEGGSRLRGGSAAASRDPV